MLFRSTIELVLPRIEFLALSAFLRECPRCGDDLRQKTAWERHSCYVTHLDIWNGKTEEDNGSPYLKLYGYKRTYLKKVKKVKVPKPVSGKVATAAIDAVLAVAEEPPVEQSAVLFASDVSSERRGVRKRTDAVSLSDELGDLAGEKRKKVEEEEFEGEEEQ